MEKTLEGVNTGPFGLAMGLMSVGALVLLTGWVPKILIGTIGLIPPISGGLGEATDTCGGGVHSIIVCPTPNLPPIDAPLKASQFR